MTQTIRDQFTEITRKALQQFISEKVSDRLKSALAREREATKAAAPVEEPAVEGPTIDTTVEEMQAYYCAGDPRPDGGPRARHPGGPEVLLLRASGRQQPQADLPPPVQHAPKYIGVLDAVKVETRVPIANLAEIYRQATMHREPVDRYENRKGTPAEPPPLEPGSVRCRDHGAERLVLRDQTSY